MSSPSSSDETPVRERGRRIVEESSNLDDWLERYSNLLARGEEIPRIPEAERSEELYVGGCQYDLWVQVTRDPTRNVLRFRVESDARIVRGLAVLIVRVLEGQPPRAVVDVRPMAAYNGWALEAESRGGHVPGAKSLPVDWTRYMDWVEVVEEKRLDRARPLTVYGYTPEEGRRMADRLTRLGFEDVSVYGRFVKKWSGDAHRPLRRLDRYRRFVLHGGLHELIGPETWNRRTAPELNATLLELGIRRDTTVVLYGRYSHPTYEEEWPARSAGHPAAMRCALIMLYAGVEDVRILNGGIHGLEEAGYPLSTRSERPVPAGDFGATNPARPGYLIDLNFDYTTREYGEIARNRAKVGVVPEKSVTFYCGTGWRAGEAFMNAYFMGCPRISVHDGGWYEWSSDPERPVERGSASRGSPPRDSAVSPDR